MTDYNGAAGVLVMTRAILDRLRDTNIATDIRVIEAIPIARDAVEAAQELHDYFYFVLDSVELPSELSWSAWKNRRKRE
jgi:hypothetical protein